MNLVLDLNKSAGLLDLSKDDGSKLKKLKIVMSWGANPLKSSGSEDFDLDLFAFSINSNEKIDGLQDVCFYKNPKIHGGLVNLPKDVRGGGAESEEMYLDLELMPTSKYHVDLYVFLFDYEKRGQDFSMMINAKVQIFDDETGDLVQEYAIRDNSASKASAMFIGRISRNYGDFKFQPFGDVARSDANGIIAAAYS